MCRNLITTIYNRLPVATTGPVGSAVGDPPSGSTDTASVTPLATRARASAGGALFLIAKPFTPEAFDEVLAPVLKG